MPRLSLAVLYSTAFGCKRHFIWAKQAIYQFIDKQQLIRFRPRQMALSGKSCSRQHCQNRSPHESRSHYKTSAHNPRMASANALANVLDPACTPSRITHRPATITSANGADGLLKIMASSVRDSGTPSNAGSDEFTTSASARAPTANPQSLWPHAGAPPATTRENKRSAVAL